MPTMKKKTGNIEKAWNKTRNPGMEKVSKIPSSEEVSVRWKTIKRTVKRKCGERVEEYLRDSTVNCYTYLGDKTLRWEERLMWWCVHLCAAAAAAYLAWVAVDRATPTGTSRNPDGISVNHVDFPGIGICPINRLSRRKIGYLANNIIAKGHTEYNQSDLVALLGYLGLSYEYEEARGEELEIIHNLLGPNYNLETIMKSSAPSCEDILVRCMWKAKVVNCSTVFQLRKTSEGFCCTFNYLRQSDNYFRNENKSEVELLLSVAGQERGLSVLLNPQLEDYLYTKMPNLGFKLMIFNPSDFPDIPSGGCLEQAVPPRREQFVALDATVVVASASVQALSKTERGCLLEADRDLIYASYSDCVISCRIKSAKNSCGCIPFFLPSASLAPFCDLSDLGCLRKWKKSWENAWSGDDQTLESSDSVSQVEKGPPCVYCVPSCSDTSYRAQRYSVKLQPESINERPDADKNILKQGIEFKDHSVVHVFFDKDNFVLLNHDIMISWYDYMSSLGGLIGLVIGCSVLSLAEIVYYLVFGGPAKRAQTAVAPARQLYWQEIRK